MNFNMYNIFIQFESFIYLFSHHM